MCLICTELTKDLITTKDARRNAQEVADTLSVEHVLELMQLIEKKEQSEFEYTGVD